MNVILKTLGCYLLDGFSTILGMICGGIILFLITRVFTGWSMFPIILIFGIIGGILFVRDLRSKPKIAALIKTEQGVLSKGLIKKYLNDYFVGICVAFVTMSINVVGVLSIPLVYKIMNALR